jgi:hypothetical protein
MYLGNIPKGNVSLGFEIGDRGSTNNMSSAQTDDLSFVVSWHEDSSVPAVPSSNMNTDFRNAAVDVVLA